MKKPKNFKIIGSKKEIKRLNEKLNEWADDVLADIVTDSMKPVKRKKRKNRP